MTSLTELGRELAPPRLIAALIFEVLLLALLDLGFGWRVLIVFASVFAWGVFTISLKLVRRRRDRVRGARNAGLVRVFAVANYPLDAAPGQLPTVVRNDKQLAAAHRALGKAVDKHDKVKLLLVSGFEHLGHQGSLGTIGRVLERKPSLDLEIIMLDPDGTEVQRREQVIPANHPPGWYADGVRDVIQQLARWDNAKPGWKIQVRLYDEEPIWQMAILGGKELWLLCAAKGMSSRYSPVYHFDLTSPFGLGWGLSSVWQRRRSIASDPIDLHAERYKPKGEVVELRGESAYGALTQPPDPTPPAGA